MKRVPLDKWSTKEKLCLASAVACSGDQNWMSVSRSLKMLCGANRPGDWFSQKSCAAQYGKLLENVETPKRKKRTASERDGVAAVETPGESILRKLTQERILELKKIIQDEAQQYTKVKEDIILIQSGVTDEMREMWKQIELEKAQKEKEQILHAQWLKEREEKKLELERQWRPMFPNSPNSVKAGGAIVKIKEETDDDSQSSSKSGTSPLLTSLLKSPTANLAGNPTLQSSSNRSATSPTITNLLTGHSPTIINIQGKNLFPATVVVASQHLDGTKMISQTQEETKPIIGESTSYRVAPNLTKLLDKTPQEIATEDLSSAIIDAQSSHEDKVEDMDTDPENVDPAKDLMAVFQELMPEELDEILNENNGMILEDEILDNVVDSIMEEEAESLKGKNLGALEEANASLVPVAEVDSLVEQTLNAAVPKNEQTTPEVEQGAYLTLAAAAPSPPHTAAEDTNVAKPEETEKAADDVSDTVDDTQDEDTQHTQKEELTKEEEKHFDTKENEVVPVDDSSSNSPVTNPSSVEIKDNVEEPADDGVIVVSDSAKEEDSPIIIKADVDDDSEDKPLASLDTTLFDTKVAETKSEENVEIKEDDDQSFTSDDKSIPSILDSKSQEVVKPQINEEDVLRAKKEALEKLASEYDFKDDEEPIVPLSIQKSKEEKHVSEEDVYMDAQENLDDPEEQKEVEPKKNEDPMVGITDTDDDSLIEMKISKTKRDYSRRRPADEAFKTKEDQLAAPKNEESEGRTLRKLRERDRSESPFVLLEDDVNDKMKRSYSSTPVMDSIPNSPASSEDRDYRVWKKSILAIHSKISALRYASILLKPLPEDHTANLIYRAMDLSTIKKNIENGTIRTTPEYQRDVMLVCTNAMMLNRGDLCSPTAARILLKESVALIEATIDVSKSSRDKEPESRSGSASKRNSRKGTTRSSTSTVRN